MNKLLTPPNGEAIVGRMNSTNHCTVTVGIGEPCGQPAVHSWTSRRSGETFHECAEHAAPGRPASSPEFTVGQPVKVSHGGIIKVGRIERVGRTQVRISVAVGSGSSAGRKTIARPMTDIEAF